MRASFRIPLFVSLVAHLALFCLLGWLLAPQAAKDRGPSLIAVRLLSPDEAAAAAASAPKGSPDEPRCQRVREARAVWRPHEAPVSLQRSEAAVPEPARQHAAASRQNLQPRTRAELRADAAAPAPPVLPGLVAVSHVMVRPSVAQPVVEEHIEVGAPPAAEPGPADPAPPEPARGVEQGDPSAAAGSPGVGEEPSTADGTTEASFAGVCKPVYPRLSRERGEQGTVVLSVEVGADGSPGKIEVVTSSGHARLDRAAIEALQKASFLPATSGGRPVASVKHYAFTFLLQDAGD